MLNRAALLAIVTLTGTVLGQQSLFSNGSADPANPALNPAATASNGTPSPNGGFWSEVPAPSAFESNALAGVACSTDSTGGVRLADNFIVPSGQSWDLQEVWLYAYQPDWSTTASPIASATLRIWYGQPGSQSASLVWGNTSTDTLITTTATTTYRIFTTDVPPLFTPPDTTRRLFQVRLAATTTLTPGEYWLDWQLTPTTPGAWLFAAPVTIADTRSQPGWNAVQFADGLWTGVIDTGRPTQSPDAPTDLAFIVRGTVGTACDTIDFNGDTIFPDIFDIEEFLTVFAGGPCSTGTCGDIDFNNDGLFPDTADIASLLSVFSGGACL